jgi:hypothetical protein
MMTIIEIYSVKPPGRTSDILPGPVLLPNLIAPERDRTCSPAALPLQT